MKLEFYPESTILIQKAEPVERFDSELADIAHEMSELMYTHEGVGLSGNQVGLLKRIFIGSFFDCNTRRPYTVCINPHFYATNLKRVTEYEGCLSIPGIQDKVTRYNSINLEYQDLKGNYYSSRYLGFQARIIQHEIDHLDGWLFPFYNLPMRPEDYFIQRDPRPKEVLTISDMAVPL